jgi:hypothetical protein
MGLQQKANVHTLLVDLMTTYCNPRFPAVIRLLQLPGHHHKLLSHFSEHHSLSCRS